MKSKILLVSLFSLMLIVSTAGGVCAVKADTIGEPKVSYDTWGEWPRWQKDPEKLNLIILSPLPNEVLNENTAIVRVNISSPAWPINSVYYEADWQEGMHRIYDVYKAVNTKMLYRVSITANFTDIPDGRHHLTFYAHIHDGSHGSSSVDFTINALPSIVILSPENKTYQTANLPLSFTVNEPMKWAGYSLDEKANITIAGNTTISNLPKGTHELRVYTADYAGNVGSSETIYFNTEPFPATLILVVSAASAVAVVVGVLVYFKKHRG